MPRRRLVIKRRWTTEEVRLLGFLARAKFPARVIAQRLARSHQSVRSAAMRWGLSLVRSGRGSTHPTSTPSRALTPAAARLRATSTRPAQ